MNLYLQMGLVTAAKMLNLVVRQFNIPAGRASSQVCVLGAAIVCLFAPTVSRAETFYTYQGAVNGNASVFTLCWLDNSVVGTFAADGKIFTLAGDNSRYGEIFLSVAYEGRTLAHMKVRKTMTEEQVIWEGSMRIDENGEIVPVKFIYNRGSTAVNTR